MGVRYFSKKKALVRDFSMWKRVFGLILFLLCCSQAHAYVWVGSAAPDFTAKDINGNEISLKKYIGKVVVLLYQDVDDPFTKKFYSRLYYENKGYIQTLIKKFTTPPNDVVWIIIDVCDPPMSITEWKDWVTQEGVPVPPTAVILDADHSLSKLYDVSRVPEAFVVNADGMLAYKGSLDSIRSSDPTDITRSSNRKYLEAALDQLLDGKAVFTPETIPYGSSVSH